MLELQKETELEAHELIERAVELFGPEGWGMAPLERARHDVHFVGGAGGHVTVEVVGRAMGVARW